MIDRKKGQKDSEALYSDIKKRGRGECFEISYWLEVRRNVFMRSRYKMT